MRILLTDQPLQPWRLLESVEATLTGIDGRCGARAVFIGSMRDFNEGDQVRGMELEHYPEMTRRYLEELLTDAGRRWRILDSFIAHRHGSIGVNDCIVVVVVWSEHRAEAFAACRYLIEELKHKAPFWKKERLLTGERWVARNTPADSESGGG